MFQYLQYLNTGIENPFFLRGWRRWNHIYKNNSPTGIGLLVISDVCNIYVYRPKRGRQKLIQREWHREINILEKSELLFNVWDFFTFNNHPCLSTAVHFTVGAASQWWSNERMMVYFKLMMVKCYLMMVKCYSMMVKWVNDHILNHHHWLAFHHHWLALYHH